MTTHSHTVADSLVSFIKRFCVLPSEDHYNVLALWIIHTYCFDAAYSTPYLYITSAEKQSGKTRVIEVLQTLVRHPMRAGGGATGAALFRVIDKDRPTLLIDEVDTIYAGAANEDLRGLLNDGYKRGGGILRYDPGHKNEDGTIGATVTLSTFAPKLLAGIDNAQLPDTVLDRSIKMTLKRKKEGEIVERFLSRKVEPEAQAIAAEVHNWAVQHLDGLMDAEPDVIEEISDRAFEISEPLLAIGEALGNGWRDRSRQAVTVLLGGEVKALSIGAQALTAARDWFKDHPSEDKIASAVLATLIGANPKRLSIILDPYGIKPGTRRIQGQPTKCYYKTDFTDAWERYL